MLKGEGVTTSFDVVLNVGHAEGGHKIFSLSNRAGRDMKNRTVSRVGGRGRKRFRTHKFPIL